MESNNEVSVTKEEILTHLKLKGRYESIVQEIKNRKRGAREAREKDLEVTDDQLQEAADRFRHERGLEKTSETRQWLENHDLDLDELEQFLEETLLNFKLSRHLIQKTTLDEQIKSQEIRTSIQQLLLQDHLQ